MVISWFDEISKKSIRKLYPLRIKRNFNRVSSFVCNNFALCNEELAMFLSGVQKKDKSELDDALEAARGPGYCPPGCGCDNPWPFLGSMK